MAPAFEAYKNRTTGKVHLAQHLNTQLLFLLALTADSGAAHDPMHPIFTVVS
jgi:hypothetical protein